MKSLVPYASRGAVSAGSGVAADLVRLNHFEGILDSNRHWLIAAGETRLVRKTIAFKQPMHAQPHCSLYVS